MNIKKNKRPERKPIYKNKILEAKPRKGFVRRFVNEEPGRVAMFLEAGWTLVVGDEDASDSKVQDAAQQSSLVRRVVNRGADARSQTAVLMEIPEDLYNEDQAAKQKKVDKIEDSYDPNKTKQSGADYGNMTRKYT